MTLDQAEVFGTPRALLLLERFYRWTTMPMGPW